MTAYDQAFGRLPSSATGTTRYQAQGQGIARSDPEGPFRMKHVGVKMEQEVPTQDMAQLEVAASANYPDGGLQAWTVATGSFAILFCTFGFANSFGVFQEYYQSHQLRHESPSTIAWIGSTQVFLLMSGNAIGGPLFDLYGAKVGLRTLVWRLHVSCDQSRAAKYCNERMCYFIGY